MANYQVPLVVCDTCVLIDILTSRLAQLPQIDSAFFDDVKSRVLDLGVSEVTVAEIAYLQSHNESVLALVDGFLANPYIRRLPMTGAVSWRASAIIRHFHLDTCDAMIVATALTHGATHFYTRDASSLCKRIKSKKNQPCVLKALPKPNPAYPDEQRVIAEVWEMNINELATIVATPPKAGASAVVLPASPPATPRSGNTP